MALEFPLSDIWFLYNQTITFLKSDFKVNKSVCIAKSRQLHDKTHNNFLLHVPNHALKDMYMLSYGTLNNTNNLCYSYILVLTDFINWAIATYVFSQATPFFTSASSYLWSHESSVWNLPSSCLLSPLLASRDLMIFATWSINF